MADMARPKGTKNSMYRLTAEGLTAKQQSAHAMNERLRAEGRSGSGYFKTHPYPESAKRKGSASVLRAIKEGRLDPAANMRGFIHSSRGDESYWQTRNWVGEHGSIHSVKNGRDVFYDSSWERERILVLEDSQSVRCYRKNPVRIPYSLNGRAHYYVPDFLIEYTSGAHVLEEIKPEWALTRPDVHKKFAVARMFCEAQGIIFRVISHVEELHVLTMAE